MPQQYASAPLSRMKGGAPLIAAAGCAQIHFSRQQGADKTHDGFQVTVSQQQVSELIQGYARSHKGMGA